MVLRPHYLWYHKSMNDSILLIFFLFLLSLVLFLLDAVGSGILMLLFAIIFPILFPTAPGPDAHGGEEE
ncbi:MAG: hypothetical protein A2564_02790 [Candidatus Wildermuthbacteria bacterium RIFOXYD1_FULL_50_12]|nr:MAG: hypothetical protein A2564_02790 [Candidatus Wildermuthbacteria bacterium RIFOXYD1_FULL_50_12]